MRGRPPLLGVHATARPPKQLGLCPCLPTVPMYLVPACTPVDVRRMELLNSVDPSSAGTNEAAFQLNLSLRKAGHPAELATAVVQQSQLRYKARTKFGPFADSMVFTQAGLEQATRLNIAGLHAQRYTRAGIKKVADLGCGIGADSLALASAEIDVTAVELDETTAAATTLNLMPWPNARVVNADATSFNLTGFDGVWLDPARRTTDTSGTSRIFDPEAFSPPLSFVENLADRGWPWASRWVRVCPTTPFPPIAKSSGFLSTGMSRKRHCGSAS